LAASGGTATADVDYSTKNFQYSTDGGTTWLAGSGPYAGKPPPGVPDLSRDRRKHPLSLADVRKLSGQPWQNSTSGPLPASA